MQPSLEVSDEDLLSRYYVGREECFDILECRYRAKMFAFAHRILQNKEDAWDAVQDMWLRMVTCRPPPLHVKALLYKILTNLCLDRLRSNKRNISLNNVKPTEIARISAESTIEAAVSGKQLLESLFAGLDPKETAIVLLRLEGVGNGEIAQTMGISESYASNIYRAVLTKAAKMTGLQHIQE